MRMYFDQNDKLADGNLLFKVSKKNYLEDLLNGKLYMNKLSSFRKYETDGLGDKEEGLICHMDSGILLADNTEIADVKNISLYAFSNNPVFCIASVPFTETAPGHYEYIIDKRLYQDFMLDSDEYGILLIRKDAFVHQIKEKLTPMSMSWLWDKVTYTDVIPNYPKDELYKHVFHKRTKFAHQNEWRLLLFTEVNDHYELEIGSIRNYAYMLPITDPNKDIKIGMVLNDADKE